MTPTAGATENRPALRRTRRVLTRRVLTIVACMAAILVSAWLARATLLRGASRWLNVGRKPERCDYVLVLPGGEETRPFAAAALIRAGLADRAPIPRVRSSPDVDEGIRQPAHEIIREVLLLKGVGPDKITLIGQDSVYTHTDALALAEFLQGRETCRVAVVTNQYHTRRAFWILRQVLADRAGDVYMVAVPTDGFDEDTWWQTREGTLTYVAEFTKFAGYLTVYGPARFWLIGLTCLAAAVFWRRRRRRACPDTTGPVPKEPAPA